MVPLWAEVVWLMKNLKQAQVADRTWLMQCINSYFHLETPPANSYLAMRIFYHPQWGFSSQHHALKVTQWDCWQRTGSKQTAQQNFCVHVNWPTWTWPVNTWGNQFRDISWPRVDRVLGQVRKSFRRIKLLKNFAPFKEMAGLLNWK